MSKDYKKLSIIIPAYNEEQTIQELIEKVKSASIGKLEKEIIVVDDGSSDKTRNILKEISDIKVILHDHNQGKGGALKTGFKEAGGEIVLVQDADLEYDPNEYGRLIRPILDGHADVVYGSRFVGNDPHRVLYVFHYAGNKFLTLLSNLLTGLNLSDMETCYKVFRKEVLDSFNHRIKSRRFGIEPELTARVAKGKWRIYEVGISYHGRTYEEGKKIGWTDGLAAIWHIIYFNLFSK